MNNTRKKLKIQIGTQEHVIAVYDPDQSKWVATDASVNAQLLAGAYLSFARAHGFTDIADAGPSTIRVEDA